MGLLNEGFDSWSGGWGRAELGLEQRCGRRENIKQQTWPRGGFLNFCVSPADWSGCPEPVELLLWAQEVEQPRSDDYTGIDWPSIAAVGL